MSEMLVTNSNISHYRIVSKIGAGGMGEVYLAEDIITVYDIGESEAGSMRGQALLDELSLDPEK